MLATLIISIIAIIGLILLVLLKPSIKIKNGSFSIYWLSPLIGAILLVSVGCISPSEVWQGLTANNAVNPLKILALFISMTLLSVFLDEVGFFRYIAQAVLKRAQTSQIKLFICIYLAVSILTVFTSNDVIILTFTPFICHFCKNANINPVPYLIGEFVGANTWSMALIIGNPTNIYLASSSGITFGQYFVVMLLPTVFGGLVAGLMLLLLFFKQLKAPLQPVYEDVVIEDKMSLFIGLAHLGCCIILLAISSYVGLEMWYICLAFAGSLFVLITICKLVKKQKPIQLVATLKRAPWELIPFVLSMFVIVLALNKNGITSAIVSAFGTSQTVLVYGTTSFLTANLINNIPMSVLYSSMVSTLEGQAFIEGTYASIIGSNIGAFLTPMGALAGIMWSGILNHHGIKFSFAKFIGYGFLISVPTLLSALGGLMISMLY